MAQTAVAIPEKIYFKIGEVCELVGVQAHVLRYWETEFPQLTPQKNRSGQRSYRRRDVEISLRIKELLYEELYTIAGARKRLQNEIRETPKLKIVKADPPSTGGAEARPMQARGLFDEDQDEIGELQLPDDDAGQGTATSVEMSPESSEALKSLASHLLELGEILRANRHK
ncbi:MAG: MerR family transcriptional regulator [Blastocatellia bacterium]|nr:MerR family transcriptional regulator [Blastocatellia bacterium]